MNVVYAVTIAAVPVLSLGMWLGFVILISRRDAADAAKLIEAAGRWFPMRKQLPPKSDPPGRLAAAK